VGDPFEKPWHGAGVGGSPALDFANTLDWRLRERPVELLKGYVDLLRFSRSVGLIDASQARALRIWGEAHPHAARRALAEATDVREAIAAVLQTVADRRPPAPAALARLEAACLAATRARALRAGAGGLAWVWREGTPEPSRPAWAAALEAARLLTSADRVRVRQCGDAECGWYFLDTSRNRSRRWCSMKVCGNRNKVRRFYARNASRKRARQPRSSLS
jgi:predicted RNA-binding Zn ribbon-like protein